MCINCLNPVFSTTDNGCISHMIKLSIASTKVCYHSLSFGSGLLHFKTFCSNSCDCSERLSLPHFVLAIAYIRFNGVIPNAHKDLFCYYFRKQVDILISNTRRCKYITMYV